jgi:hypothetical protein
MPIAGQKTWVRAAWTVFLVLSLASLGLFIVLCSRGEFPWIHAWVHAAAIAVWIAFGTFPFLKPIVGGKNKPPTPEEHWPPGPTRADADSPPRRGS